MRLLTVILLFVSSLAICQDKTGYCGASNYYMIGIGYTTLVGGAQRSLMTDVDGVGKLIDITVDNKIDYFYTWGAASTGNKLVSIINVIQLIN